jgi:hypothetical protein
LLPFSPESSVFSSALKTIKIKICKAIILPVVLYECETWSLTLREEHRLKVFENRDLRRIFELKKNEVMGGWRKLHNEELQDLYSSPSIIRHQVKEDEVGGGGEHCANMEQEECI